MDSNSEPRSFIDFKKITFNIKIEMLYRENRHIKFLLHFKNPSPILTENIYGQIIHFLIAY